jgi:phage terminase large subunit
MELIVNTTISYQHLQNNNSRTIHLVGGTRSGKTYAILQWLIVKCLTDELNVSIVRQSMPSLRRSVVKDFKDIMESLDIWDVTAWHDTNKVYTFESGAVITFFSTDDEGKIRGVKADISWIEEASEVSEDASFQIGIRTTKLIIYSYNPTISPYHWLRQQYGNGNVSVHKTTYLDNPYLSKEQVAAIEDLKTKNPKYWQIYGQGEYAGNERQIYRFEVVDEIPIEVDFICLGMDFGFATDPTALVGLYKWGENIYLKEFVYERGLTSNDIVSRLKQLSLNREEIWCDSADPRLIEEIYRSGFNAKAVTKGKDSIRFGINTLLNYRIYIEKGSQNLINEMYAYQWAADKNGYVTDTPEGGLDHLLDAARYAAMMRLSVKAVNKGKYNITIR